MADTIRVFIDTEFNGPRGELISLALVSEYDDDPVYYQVFTVVNSIKPWVDQHVIPYVHCFPTSTCRLETWLRQLVRKHQADVIEVIADWPDDIRYLCETLLTGPGKMIKITAQLVFVLDLQNCAGPHHPAIPHNALSDAAANRLNYLHHTSDEEE